MIRLLLLLACAVVWLAGCVYTTTSNSTSLSERIIAPGGVSPLIPRELLDAAFDTLDTRTGRVLTGDAVEIFWRAIDPADYRIRYDYLPARSGHAVADFALAFSSVDAAPMPPLGTVVLLHGWMMDGDSLLPWSLQLADAGYRAISIDLRNHGQSGAAPSGFGVREAADVGEVVAALRARGEIQGPLYLFGVSYGAATSLFAARQLGDEVAGVIAMESFANAGRGIRDMIPYMLSEQPDGLVAQAGMRLARWKYGSQDLDAVVAAAGDALGIDLDAVDVGQSLQHVDACVLLMHGDADRHIPVAHGRSLAAMSGRVQYLEMPGEDHLSLPMRLDVLGPLVEQWLAGVGASGASCPESPALPATYLSTQSLRTQPGQEMAVLDTRIHDRLATLAAD